MLRLWPTGLGAAGTPQIDIDDLRHMMQLLLIERFKMKVHTEDREISAYTLTAANPKIKKADPTNRTGCKEGPGPDGKDPRIATPILARLLNCQNITMAQFAEALQAQVGGYIFSPVKDATGLEGAYDFVLSFSPVGLRLIRAQTTRRCRRPHRAMQAPRPIRVERFLCLTRFPSSSD